MKRVYAILMTAAGVAGLLCGCAMFGGGGELEGPTDTERISRFLRRTRDPRSLWLTVYDSDYGPVFENAFRIHPNQVVRMSWEDNESPAPVIDLTIARSTVPALIDTTASGAWMVFDTAERCGLIAVGPPLYQQQPLHVDLSSQGLAAVADKVKLDTLHMESGVFFVLPPDAEPELLLRGLSDPAPEAVLGWQMLRRFRTVQFDWPAQSVGLSTSIPYEPDDSRLIGSTTLHDGGAVMVVDGSMNGERYKLLLDVAGDYELAMADPATNRVRQLAVGEVVFRQVEVTPLDSQAPALSQYPRVGRRLLERFRMTIDNRRRLVFFERPSIDEDLP